MTDMTYAPGTVAMLSWPKDAEHHRAGQTALALLDEKGYWRATNGTDHHTTSTVGLGDQQVRPLAVIDPEDGNAVLRLTEVFMSHLNRPGIQPAQALTDALAEYANPNPPEPGPLAVVRVTTRREATSRTTQLVLRQETTREDGLHWDAHSHTWAMVCAMDVDGTPVVVNPSPVAEGGDHDD